MIDKERYIWARDKMEEAVYTWKEFCRILDCPEPEEFSENYKAERTAWVQKRNNIVQSINNRAASNDQNWRIKNYSWGESIQKVCDHALTDADAPDRIKRIVNAIEKARTEFRILEQLESMPTADKKLFRLSHQTLYVLTSSLHSTIDQMKSIPHDTKSKLKAVTDVDPWRDDEEYMQDVG